MEEKKQTNSVELLIPKEQTINTDVIESLLDNKQERNLLSDNPPDSKTLLDSVIKQINELSNNTKNCLEHLTKEIKELKAADHVITELSARCTELTEQYNEREFFLPIFYCLIGTADRCRQQVEKFRNLLDKNPNEKNTPAAKAITYLIDARKADLVEIENLLANFGVEPYEHHTNTFEPSLQKSISRIECDDQALHGRIAQRLLPAYKRHGKIIRQECVSVYIPKK